MFRSMLKRVVIVALVCTGGATQAQGVQVAHERPSSRAIAQVQDQIRQQQILEGMAREVDRVVDLPGPLGLVSAECGRVNAFYVPAAKKIVMCLELFPYVFDQAQADFGREASAFQLFAVPTGAIGFVFFHELGHALIDALQIPVLGREEDAADQISTYLLLQDRQFSEVAVRGGLWFFTPRKRTYSQEEFSGEHGLDLQRRANIACWAYGKDPNQFRWALAAGGVSRERAARCQTEYLQIERAVRGLLGARLKVG